jgi:hypothetical protein
LLHLEGYESVDPQSPLGGPDGLKDILCTRDGEKWVAAVFFATTRQRFSSIAAKFVHDLEGLRNNDSEGIAFFVNQPLTVSNRAALISEASPNKAEIYHLERIRSILDSPKGYGVRLQYLRVSMTEDEQLGFFSVLKDDLTERFLKQERSMVELHRKMDAFVMQTTALIEVSSREPSSLIPFPDAREGLKLIHFPTASLSIGQLRWLHRVVTDGSKLPNTQRGHLRSVAVWIGPPGCGPEEASFVPPPPEEVLPRTTALLEDWCSRYPTLVHATPEAILEELTAFHHGFLFVHPFLDANGRVARAILQQQALELLRRNITAEFTAEPRTYYEALQKAHQGDQNDLKNLIQASLE